LEETASFIAQNEQGKVTKSCVVGNTIGALSASRTPQNPHLHLGQNAGHVVAPLTPTETIASQGRDFVRHGHGHFTSSCRKCVSCGAWGHRDASSRICPQNANRKQPQWDRGPRVPTKDTYHNNTGYVFDQLCTAG